MDSTTSFVMALVAVVVSGFSAVASFIAIGQNARHHPKPFIHVSITATSKVTDPKPVFYFEVTNYGNAPARNVSLYLRNRTTGWSGVSEERDALEPSDTIRQRVSMVKGDFGSRGGAGVVVASGAPRAMQLEFELTYRQLPGVRRLRSIVWRIDTLENAGVLIHAGRERGWMTQAIVEVAGGFRDAMSDIFSNLRKMF